MQLKPKKLTNKELIENLFRAIETDGYHITDKIYGNCYFLFEDEDDSICHFHIKEIPGFLFAVWNTCRFDNIRTQIRKNGIGNTWADSLQISPKSELVFFTQYERDIDKFKPSQSGFVTGLYREVWEESETADSDKLIMVEEWNKYDLDDILKFMKKHPIKAYVYCGLTINNIYQELSGLTCLKIYIEDYINHIKYKLEKYLKLKYQIFVSKHLVKKLGNDYYSFIALRDECWTPRLEVILRRKENIDYRVLVRKEKIVDTFKDKYINDIGIEQFDFVLDKEPMTDEDIKEDKKLLERYKSVVQAYYDDLESDVIWDNK